MSEKWTCRECLGRTGRYLTFEVTDTKRHGPDYCPWCGQTRTIETVTSYIKSRYDHESHPFEEEEWL